MYIGDNEHPYSVYDFTNSHSRDGPASFMQGYSGYLHADAYTGYDSIFLAPGSPTITHVRWLFVLTIYGRVADWPRNPTLAQHPVGESGSPSPVCPRPYHNQPPSPY